MSGCIDQAATGSKRPTSAAGPESGLLNRAALAYHWVANRPVLACAVVFFLTLGIRAALLPWMHVPEPAVHDEFSYLLAADTYASGRLANPPHPFWEHFEMFHVIQQPTYASKYPPLPGLVLAFGEKLFGQPWVGVLIGTALMCAAVCWMLQGWISPGAALLGALLIMLRLGTFDYWMNSYYGGAVPAIGGALVFGAIARIVLRGQLRHGVTLGAGLAILLTSRPYDFLVLALIAAAVLAWSIWWKKMPARASLHAALLAAAILAIAGAGMAYNNYCVTGNTFQLPYQLHDQQYAVTSVFLWSTPHAEPVYHHAVLRKFWTGWFVHTVKTAQNDLLGSFFARLSTLYDFFFGFWPLLIPPLIWPYRFKTTEERLTAVLLGASLIAIVAPLAGIIPHYVACLAGLLYLRLLQTLARLQSWRPFGKPYGLALATACVALFVYHFAAKALDLRTGEQIPRLAIARDAVIRTLQKQPGPKLVLVRYSPEHYVHDDWVDNLANIDAQPIVWAREMGVERDRPLIQYFRNRQVWLLEPDFSPVRLTPYDAHYSSRLTPKVMTTPNCSPARQQGDHMELIIQTASSTESGT